MAKEAELLEIQQVSDLRFINAPDPVSHGTPAFPAQPNPIGPEQSHTRHQNHLQILTGVQALESNTEWIQLSLTTFATDVAEARHDFIPTVQHHLKEKSGDEAPRREESLGDPSPVHNPRCDDYIIPCLGCDTDVPAVELQEESKKFCAANDKVAQAWATKMDLCQGLYNESLLFQKWTRELVSINAELNTEIRKLVRMRWPHAITLDG